MLWTGGHGASLGSEEAQELVGYDKVTNRPTSQTEDEQRPFDTDLVKVAEWVTPNVARAKVDPAYVYKILQGHLLTRAYIQIPSFSFDKAVPSPRYNIHSASTTNPTNPRSCKTRLPDSKDAPSLYTTSSQVYAFHPGN